MATHPVSGSNSAQNRAVFMDVGSGTGIVNVNNSTINLHSGNLDKGKDITSWAVFKQNINQYGGASHVNFAGNEIVAETRGGFYKWKYQFKCFCRDVTTGHAVKVSGYESACGAAEHGCAKLIREMVQRGIYPAPTDLDQMPHD